MTYTILFVLLAVAVHAIRKRTPARVRRPRLEYKPGWYQAEVVDMEEPEAIEEPEEAADTRRKEEQDRMLARADIDRWEALKMTYIDALDAIDIEMTAMPQAEAARRQDIEDIERQIGAADTSPRQAQSLRRELSKAVVKEAETISRNNRRRTTLSAKRASITSKIANLDRLIDKAYATVKG